MSTYPGLPSYVRVGSDVSLDFKNLAYIHLVEGEIQQEARDFLLWVMEHHGVDDLSATFERLRAADPRLGESAPKLQGEGDFFAGTLALAALKDIAPFAHIIEQADTDKVRRYLMAWGPAVDVDVVQLLKGKGDLPLKAFCELYDMDSEQLAIKVVADDCVAGYDVIAKESPKDIESALSHFPYNPLTAIRSHIGHQPGIISRIELRHRFKNQVVMINGDDGAIDPSKPVVLRPGVPFNWESIGALDQKLRVFPGYLPMLREDAIELAADLSFYASLAKVHTAEQLQVIAKLMEDFMVAGVPSVDLLMAGIMNFAGYGTKKYLELAPEYRESLYPKLLLDSLSSIADSLQITGDQLAQCHRNKLFQLQKLIDKDTTRTLEALCTQPAQWHGLYLATGDRKYLKHLSGRIESVFSSDLGL
ncbi:hypothetical protein [Pseudomonas amygdali]|uniref:Uncharacterized protein n=2 Tax=Pseudomonas amygdali pv. lachrymans TaxID=53707 RepID=A0ABR5KQ98_PSEAV|nr:hypothetical protein [Pseudomonas amygdali]AXH59557.1 hypothetical protein PLA107_030495 [Pseudomonas amygdali pv. lachrymans str. M301315]KPC16985.1 Uncharacterized protein AC499_0187 [Pseudomonas amygdali pv. lachrymans]KPC17944.1 Uncharacterized protein AC499_1146 [Pseudomonas amygdali pv. lachrymans]RMT06341.1 hypothetical protein ALP54_03479 [Pseudomonas amygdali pv. lachrymans]